MAKSYQMIDLFSGAGGMTHGFRRAGFVPALAIEKEPDFAATYRTNFGAHVLTADIAEIIDGGGITHPGRYRGRRPALPGLFESDRES